MCKLIVNSNSVHLCSPVKIFFKKVKTTIIDGNMITVNWFLSHCIKEIEEVGKYEENLRIAPSSTVNVYRYSDIMLKYMLQNLLKTFEKMHFFWEREQVPLFWNSDRGSQHISSRTATQRRDANLIDKIGFC